MKILKPSFPSFLAALVFAITTSHAATVTNFSFEDDVVSDGTNKGGTFTGWIASSEVAGYQNLPVTPAYTPIPTNGNQNAFTNGSSSLSKGTMETIRAGHTYTLTVDVGQLNVFADGKATIRLYDSDVGIGATIAEDAAFAPKPGSYATRTVTYTAPAGGPFEGKAVGIALLGVGGKQVLFDNVRLEVTSKP